MRITDVAVTPVRMGRRDTEWRNSTYAGSVVDANGVQNHTDDGVSGVGAASVIKSYGDTPEAIHSTIRDLFVPRLLGKDPFDIEPILRDLRECARHAHHARCAVDLALHDLKATALGVPVYQLLGGAYRKEVPVIRMVGMKAPIAQARTAASFVAEGYRALKLKIGADPDEDVARVAEVRRAVGEGVILTVDANGAYDVKTAIRVIRRIEEYGVQVAEQPTGYADLEGLGRVARAVDMPVMADQVVTTTADAIQLVRRQAADVLTIKVMNGGLSAALAMRAICDGAALPYHVGGAASSRILDAASVHFAVASPDIAFGCEIGEFMGLDGDMASGLEVRDGMLRVPEGPGLGISLAMTSQIEGG